MDGLRHKQTLRIVNHVGQTALGHRDVWLEECIAAPPTPNGPLAGKRVFVSTDGGRTRIRVQSKAGRPRAETGHRKYNAPWKEPKLLVIYVVDDEGNVDESFTPIYDGTMGDADAVFRMLLGYLRHLGAHEAKELMFVADGAIWIWDRVAKLAEDLGLPAERVCEVVDWYHALETLHTIAGLPAQWSKSQRNRWVNEARALLRKGRIDALEAHIRKVAVGRRAKKVLSHLGYFRRNDARMQYHDFKARNVVRGSGAMESAVRRVINMRLKSNAKYWLLENAQAMLLLRGYSKAGRFNELMTWTYARQVPWWRPAPPDFLGVPSCDAAVIDLNRTESQSGRPRKEAA